MKATTTFNTLAFSMFAIAGAHAAEGDPAGDQPAAEESAAEEVAEEPATDVMPELEAAAKKLADAVSFSWTQTISTR